MRRISVDFSGLDGHVNQALPPCQRNAQSRCLCGLLHVKTATALLTTGYLGALAFLDWLAYNVPLTEVDRGLVSAASIKLILVVLTAQLGLFRERYALLVPLIVSQLIIGFILLVACGYVIVIQIAYACAHANVAGQVAALVAIEGGVIVIHGYAVLIVYRCMRYLKTREPQASEECSGSEDADQGRRQSPAARDLAE
ncbi:hypothetical protein AAVH_05802 [Aphelenchoides avenae]|nr:hypothetical protein AAVH_05802 [Aphelenchus avenae]